MDGAELRKEVNRVLDLCNQLNDRNLQGEKIPNAELADYFRTKARIFRAMAKVEGSDALELAERAEREAQRLLEDDL